MATARRIRDPGCPLIPPRVSKEIPLRRRHTFVLVPLALLGLVGAGCGGGDAPADKSPTPAASSGDAKTILSSIKPITQQGPQKIGVKIGVTLKGTLKEPMLAAFLGDGAISVDLAGPIDPAAKAADLTFGVKAGKVNLAGGLRLVGDKAFLKLKDKWYALPADALTGTTSGAENIDPTKILAALGDPSELIDNVVVVGTEDIEGIATDHITGDLDVAALVKAIARVAQSLGPGATGPIDAKEIAKATAQIEKSVTNAQVALWIGRDDKQVHRFKIDLSAALDAKTKESSGLDGLDVTATLTSTPADSPDVEAPAGAGTVEELQTDILPILLGGLGGVTP